MKPAAGLVALLGIVVASAACGGHLRPAAPLVTPAGVRFVFVDAAATSVAVAGSFNQWSPSAHLLARDARIPRWSATVRLPPGEYQFMFVIDGTTWIAPPAAEGYVDDGFGARNGIVVVGSEGK